MKLPPVQFDMIEMRGGLDLVTPTMTLVPGAMRDCLNYDVAVSGGYRRTSGYERLDGRPAPSSASYQAFSVTLTSTPALYSTITGVTSGETAVVVKIETGVLVVTDETGPFTVGETLNVSGSPIGVYDGFVDYTAKTNAQYTAAAADYYRSLIQKPAGSGPVRGAFKYKGNTYAFRDNAGGTAAVLHKASATGWAAVALGYELSFSAGVSQIIDGDTVVGLTSGATGIVSRVALQSGTWGTDAAGRLILSSTTGTFSAGETLRVGGVNRATCGGAAAAITLLPGGRFEFDQGNLSGSAGTVRIYGCDGVNRGFEFDGTVFVPIVTGMSVDTPKHVKVHRSHLFFSFGASIQHSGLGAQYQWTVITGASELALGDEVTGFSVMPGSSTTAAMAVYSLNNTFVLYGTSSANWNLVSFNSGVGGMHYTAQVLAGGYVFDQRGLMSLQPTIAYGNFDTAALTYNIQPIVVQNRTKIIGSTVNREKSQYRVFFDDGYALYSTIVNDKYKGTGLIWFPDSMYNTWSGEDTDGTEITLLCGADGYVYQLDVGTSFDGKPIPATYTTNYSTSKGPRILKRYRKLAPEIQSSGYAEVDFSFSLGYGDDRVDQPASVNYTLPFNTAAYWDSFTWDFFVFDGQTMGPTECELDGTAENISLTFASNSAYMSDYTINTAIIHYTPRRIIR